MRNEELFPSLPLIYKHLVFIIIGIVIVPINFEVTLWYYIFMYIGLFCIALIIEHLIYFVLYLTKDEEEKR